MTEVDMQKIAISRILAGENFFLTGGAGKGKSYVIKKVTDNRTIVCAPTGNSAINVGGLTCHSLFSLPLTLPTVEDRYKVGKKMKSLILEGGVKRIIIDEISLLRADNLDLINTKLQTMLGNKKPFGGIQLVVVGDFYQIEPIVHYTEEDVYFEDYDTAFAFGAKCWDFGAIELTKSYRNTNLTQLKVLDSVRTKDKNYKKALDWIKRNAKPYVSSVNTLHLCCFNADANALNQIHYRNINNPEFSYRGVTEDEFSAEMRVVKNEIKLKVGARVLLKANGGAYVNGDRGTVYYLDTNIIQVKLDRNDTVTTIEPFTWTQHEYKVSANGLEPVIKGKFTQYPIALGYAISVHASQGSTLDDVALDFGAGCFCHGQAYTAFSRIKNLKNMSIIGDIEYDSIICDPKVQEFYKYVERKI